MRGQYMYQYYAVHTERERERETQYTHSTFMDFNFECNQISVHNSLSNSLS